MLLCDIKNGDVYEREVSGLAMISLYVSDDWDFTRHLNDPWYMNLLEEDIPSFIAGEGNLPFAVIIVIVTVLAEILRKVMKYDTLKGVRVSFIPFAFSFYAYSAHWWFDTENSLAEAVKEMPAGYADKMSVVIDNIPVLFLMLALTVPVAILGMRIAEKVMKKQTALLK